MTPPVQAGAGLILKFTPVFYVCEDQKILLVKNAVSVFSSRNPGKAIYQNPIEVVSGNTAGDPAVYWLGENGRKLSEVAQQLLQQSLEIAFKGYLSLWASIICHSIFYISCRFHRDRVHFGPSLAYHAETARGQHPCHRSTAMCR